MRIIRKIIQKSIRFIPVKLRDRIKRIPIISSLQRSLIELYFNDNSFIHTVDHGPAKNLKIEIKLPKDKPIWLGNYEKEFVEKIIKEVKNGSVCFDVGSYIGYTAATMALNGASCVYCFEPQPDNIQALKRLCELNPHLPIHIVPKAIGMNVGLTDFVLMPDASMGKLSTSLFQPEKTIRDKISIPVITIDEFVQENKITTLNLIKIDVEGAEVQVLIGAKNTLIKQKPVLFIEAHGLNLQNECSKFLLTINYTIEFLEKVKMQKDDTRHIIAKYNRHN